MAHITFKTKIIETDEKRFIQVPKITRSHCDMNYFRCHRNLGSYANSDLFLSILARCVKPQLFSIEELPKNWAVDDRGFLAVVQIDATNFSTRGDGAI